MEEITDQAGFITDFFDVLQKAFSPLREDENTYSFKLTIINLSDIKDKYGDIQQ